MIDTHSHLLPGLDDGSPDTETSLRMAAEAASTGVTAVVCTPHLRELNVAFVARAREEIEQLRSALAAANIPLRLLLGFEVDIGVVAVTSADELRQLAIEGSGGAILLETPHWGWPVYIRESVFRLRTAGFTPVLAHPERNDRIQREPDLLSECLQAGGLAQATVASLSGGFGRACKRAFYRHLFRGEISLLASDAHSRRPASWTVAPLAGVLRRRISEEDVNSLVTVNPGILLSGGRPAAVRPAQTHSSWSSRMPWLKSS